MRDEASIQRQLERERSFRPPYCPNRNCKHHLGGQDFWQRDGKKRIKRFPYHSQRFRCRSCDRTFAYSFFFLQYQQHTWGKNELIYQHHRIGVSARESGRILGHSERMIRGRKKKMARWGLLVHAKFLESLKIEEEIVYDGLENFAYSQYDPNNLNHAVGKRSLFTYDFNLCPLNRKGRMSPAQVRRKKKIEETHGAYPRDAIRTATRRDRRAAAKEVQRDLGPLYGPALPISTGGRKGSQRAEDRAHQDLVQSLSELQKSPLCGEQYRYAGKALPSGL
jgi:transposase-like protein